MKKKIILIHLFLVFYLVSNAQLNGIWTLGTSFTVLPKKMEIGVFSPLRYGLTPKLELQTFWEANYKLPNVAVKKYWGKIFWDFHIASRHGIYYPTMLVRRPLFADFFSVADTFGLAPHTLVFRNEVLLSKFLVKKTSCTAPNHLMTIKLGIANALVMGDTALVPYYPQHLIFTRASVLKKNILSYLGLDFTGHLGQKLDYFTDLEFQSVGWGKWLPDTFAVEHKGGIIYPLSEKWRMAIGYKLATGNYPKPKAIFFSPMFDFIYSFEAVKKRQIGLFKRKMF